MRAKRAFRLLPHVDVAEILPTPFEARALVPLREQRYDAAMRSIDRGAFVVASALGVACGRADAPGGPVRDPGALAYARAKACDEQAIATRRPSACADTLGRLGVAKARSTDHARLAGAARAPRDAELRRDVAAQLGGIAHEVRFDDDGFVSELSLVDACVGPRARGPVAYVDADDVTLAAEIIARAPNLFGVPAGAALEFVCNSDARAEANPRVEARWPGRFDGDHPPILTCVLVTPASAFGGRITVQRSANVVTRSLSLCKPGLVIGGHLWPAAAEPPAITVDLPAFRASGLGRSLTRAGSAGGRFCMPILPIPGQAPPGEHCTTVAPVPAETHVVRATRVGESRALAWDAARAMYVVARRLTLTDADSGAVLDEKWDPPAPGPVVAETPATSR